MTFLPLTLNPTPTPLPNLIGPWVDVRSFAPPNYPRDGVRDWAQYLQSAIDYLIMNQVDNGQNPGGKTGTNVGTLYLPPGVYRITRSLEISLFDSARYSPCSIQVTGDAPGLGGAPSDAIGGSPLHGSILFADFTDAPAIIVEGARAVVLRNLVIQGLSDWVERPGGVALDKADPKIYYDDDTFVYTPPNQATPTRTDIYSPYVGISIDPFDNRFTDPITHAYLPRPPGGGYPALQDRYVEGLGSAGVTIEGCHILNFVVGIAISCSGSQGTAAPPPGVSMDALGNAEAIRIKGCFIDTTESSIAVGQQACRQLVIESLNASLTRYVINCTSYGKGGGTFPSIFGLSVDFVKYIFSSWSGGASTASVNGAYCAHTLSIGQLTGGASSDGTVFNACTFSFLPTPKGKPALFRFRTSALSIFNACRFTMDSVDEPMWFAVSNKTSFNNCYFDRTANRGITDYPCFFIIGSAFAWSQYVSFDNSVMELLSGRPPPPNIPPAPAIGQDARAALSKVQPLDAFSSYTNTCLLPGSVFHEITPVYNPTAPSLRWVGGGLQLIPLVPGDYFATTNVQAKGDGTATFKTLRPELLRQGDFIFAIGMDFDVYDGKETPITTVIGMVASDPQADGIVNLVYAPEVINSTNFPPPNPPIDPGGQNLRLCIAHWPRSHLPSRANITAGSNQVTLTTVNNAWDVGNRVRAEGLITPGTYITALDATFTILTLSASALGSGVDVRLFDADVRSINTDPL